MTPTNMIKNAQEKIESKKTLSAMDIRRKYGVSPISKKKLVDLYKEGK
ncbi:MAG TPA: hypothetical protein GXX18_04025 [Bacillales bacterium]|nr:hypothetical protein [Bacillales bacterium]